MAIRSYGVRNVFTYGPPKGKIVELYPDVLSLSRREREVLHEIATGKTNRAIAKELGISERTAREHVARIMLKLRISSRVEAAVIAVKWQMLELGPWQREVEPVLP